jgi:hypothetical protein
MKARSVALLAVILAACATPAATMTDASRVWCYDWANEVGLGQAAVTLGVDTAPAASIVTVANPSLGLHFTIGDNFHYWANGGDGANVAAGKASVDAISKAYRKEIATWEAASPSTFSRVCLAAFAAR